MGRRSFEETSREIRRVLEAHAGRTRSVQDIAREAGVSPETAKRDLELLEHYGVVFEDEQATYESYVIATPDENALFSLPLTTKQLEDSKRVYRLVEWICKKNTRPIASRTVKQKMASDIAAALFPEVPRGWYRFGKVLVLQDNEQDMGALTEPGREEQRIAQKVYDAYAGRGAKSAMRAQYEANAKSRPIYLQRLKVEDSFFFSTENANEIRYHRIRDFRSFIGRSDLFPESSQLASETALGLEEIFRDAYENSREVDETLSAMRETFDELWTLIAHLEFLRSLGSFYDPQVLVIRFNADVKLAMDTVTESFRSIDYEPSYDLPNDGFGSFLNSLQQP